MGKVANLVVCLVALVGSTDVQGFVVVVGLVLVVARVLQFGVVVGLVVVVVGVPMVFVMVLVVLHSPHFSDTLVAPSFWRSTQMSIHLPILSDNPWISFGVR